MGGRYLLAIDAGTGGCRAVLFTETAAQAGVGQREWTHHEPPGVPGGQDFDVHAGWQAIAACVQDALRAAGATRPPAPAGPAAPNRPARGPSPPHPPARPPPPHPPPPPPPPPR